jgi:hypothetical protein
MPPLQENFPHKLPLLSFLIGTIFFPQSTVSTKLINFCSLVFLRITRLVCQRCSCAQPHSSLYFLSKSPGVFWGKNSNCIG